VNDWRVAPGLCPQLSQRLVGPCAALVLAQRAVRARDAQVAHPVQRGQRIDADVIDHFLEFDDGEIRRVRGCVSEAAQIRRDHRSILTELIRQFC
jgi:hypothetical protein